MINELLESVSEPRILCCWKEIAQFFGKGVRTVQRWEALGLPVYRPSPEKNIVFADPAELRRWALSNAGFVDEVEKTLDRKLSPSQRRLLALANEIIDAERATAEATTAGIRN